MSFLTTQTISTSRMAIRLAIRRQRASPAAAIPSMVQTGLSDIPPNTTRVAR